MWQTYDGGHFWGMHFIWWIIWFSFIIWAIAKPAGNSKRSKRGSALGILTNRFARGEITKAEFDAMKEILLRS